MESETACGGYYAPLEETYERNFPEIGEKKFYFQPSLYIQRKMIIAESLRTCKEAQSVLFVGCGSGNVMNYVMSDGYQHLCGIDIQKSELERGKVGLQPKALHYIQPVRPQLQVVLRHMDVTRPSETQNWMKQFDCVVCTEVIEHLAHKDVEKCMEFIFEKIDPQLIVITTPNKDFNRWWWPEEEKWQKTVRDEDHKFEFTRVEFNNFVERFSKKFGELFRVKLKSGVGEWQHSQNVGEELKFGFATFVVVFERKIVRKKKRSIHVLYDEIEIDTFGAYHVIDYPKDKSPRDFKMVILSEVSFIYSFCVQNLPKFRKTGFVPIDSLYERLILRERFKRAISNDGFWRVVTNHCEVNEDFILSRSGKRLKIVFKKEKDNDLMNLEEEDNIDDLIMEKKQRIMTKVEDDFASLEEFDDFFQDSN